MITPAGRVAIIGGGWAGLACAVELTASGVAVSLFESARQLGGRARRVELDGRALDNGQHLLLGAYSETLRLMRQVGGDPARLLQRHRLTLAYPSSDWQIRLPKLPAPLHLATGLLRTKSPWAENVAAARFVRALQAQNYHLADNQTVAQLLDEHGQSGLVRQYLWESLCFAALNTAPQDASAQVFAHVLRDSLGGPRASTDLLLPATNLGDAFPDRAADFIARQGGTIHFSTRVDRLEYNDRELAINGEAFDQVVLAVAPQHAVALLDQLAETQDIAQSLADYRYEPIATVYAAYPTPAGLPVPEQMPLIGLEGDPATSIGQWAIPRPTDSSNPDERIIAFVLSAHGHWETLTNAALSKQLHDELARALARPLPRPNWTKVIREQRATFSCRPGLFRPACATPVRGLWLAGDYVYADYPATLEGAVRSGVAAARRICAQS